MTPPTFLTAKVANEIKRVGATHVFVLGGSDVVSDSVYTAIQNLDLAVSVIRLAGDDRTYTSIEIAENYHAPWAAISTSHSWRMRSTTPTHWQRRRSPRRRGPDTADTDRCTA